MFDTISNTSLHAVVRVFEYVGIVYLTQFLNINQNPGRALSNFRMSGQFTKHQK